MRREKLSNLLLDVYISRQMKYIVACNVRPLDGCP